MSAADRFQPLLGADRGTGQPAEPARRGPNPPGPVATVRFNAEAHHPAVDIFSSLCRERLHVRAVTHDGDTFIAECVEVTVDDHDGQARLVLDPWSAATQSTTGNTRALDIYNELASVEVL